MKKIILGLVLLSVSSFADTYVSGYYKSNGTYVPGYYKSDSNNSYNDNWSTQGNVNPYTGKKGTKKRKNY